MVRGHRDSAPFPSRCANVNIVFRDPARRTDAGTGLAPPTLSASMRAMTSVATPATEELRRVGVEFRIHPYEVADRRDDSYGEAVADALGVDPRRVFKTLVAAVDGSPVVGIVPVASTMSLKKLARAAGGKKAKMADPHDAERLTGYVVGGISPFGRRRRLPVFCDRSAAEFDTMFVSGGRRGIQLEVAPDDLVRLTGATFADLSA